MNLGETIARLENGATDALADLGDVTLLANVAQTGARHGEAPGEYAANASRRFAALASDEEWLAMANAIGRAGDPAGAALETMLRWALARDEAEFSATECPQPCGCGGHGQPA